MTSTKINFLKLPTGSYATWYTQPEGTQFYSAGGAEIVNWLNVRSIIDRRTFRV